VSKLQKSQEKQPNNTLSATLAWFDQARPQPTNKQFHTQLGVHFEEVGEMIDEIFPLAGKAEVLLHEARVALKALSAYLKTSEQAVTIHPENRKDFLDAICDQIVTGTGVAAHAGFPVVEAMDEVNASNWSKFVDGKALVDANGKIMKGPDYFQADLGQFVPKRIPIFDQQ
jgi:hypothetical protein